MKKLILLIAFSLTLSIASLKAQNFFDSISGVDSINFFEEILKIDSLYNTVSDTVRFDTANGYKNYIRWKHKLGSRIDSTGFLDSFLTTYVQVSTDISSTYSKTGDEISWCGGQYVANWKSVGFKVKPPDNGQAWRNGVGWMHSVWVNPNNEDEMFGGSNGGGLWVTTNGGQTWTAITTNKFDGMGISSIAVNPLNTDIIYVAPAFGVRGQGIGVWKTVDGGASWFRVYSENSAVRKIVIHPNDTAIVFAIINNRVFRTKNGGDTDFKLDEAWGVRTSYDSLNTQNDTEDIAGSGNYDWADIEIEDLGTTAEIHVTGTNYHMISYDDGDTYESDQFPLTSPHIPSRFDYSLGPNQIVQCQITIRNDGEKYKAYLAGGKIVIERWNKTTSVWEHRHDKDFGSDIMGPRQKAVLQISTVDANTLYIGGVYFHTYDDQEVDPKKKITWHRDIHNDMRGMVVVGNSTSENIYIANDGGMTKANVSHFPPRYDGTNNIYDIIWEDISDGLQVQQIHGLSITNEEPSRIYTGHQDIGIIHYDGISKSWSQSPLSAGDGGEVLSDPEDPSKLIWSLGGPPVFSGQLVPNSVDLYYPSTYNIDFIFTETRNLYYVGVKCYLNPDCPSCCSVDDSKYRLLKYKDPFSSSYSNSTDRTVFSFKFPGYASALHVSSDENTIYVAIESYGTSNPEEKLYRSLDGGSTWQNASQFISNWNGSDMKTMLSQTFITDIEANPDDDDEIYFSFGYIPSSSNPNFRVAKTTNATASGTNVVTFTNWSEGLTVGNIQGIQTLPVSKLVFDELSGNNMVYAATDMGVYYRNDNTNNEWIRFSEELPFALSADLIIDRKEHRLLLATYGRGLWATDLPCCSESATTTNITTNTTISSESVFNTVFNVKNGYTLTLKDATFWFKPNSKIIVEKGGKLVLENALLTSYCNSFWGGIQVLGDWNAYNDVINQGSVTMTSSTIQYAYRGIYCGDDVDATKAGGIVIANSSTFKDCRVAITFNPYPNYSPPLSHLSFSKINQCDFLWTGALPDGSGKGMLQGISMHSINGIQLQGNQFINRMPEKFNDENVFSDGERGTGILGIDASFIVDGYSYSQTDKCHQTIVQNNLFEGLTNGIVLLNSTNINTRNTVITSTFKNCQTGINAVGDIYSKFFKNNFEWNENFVDDNPNGYGISYYPVGSSTSTSKALVTGIVHNGSDGFLTEANTVTYTEGFDRYNNYNAFAFNEVKGTNADYAVRNTILNNISTSNLTPDPFIIGKSLTGDCLNLDLSCNEYCNLHGDWYWLNDNVSKVSNQTPNYNNFSDPSTTRNTFNVNYYLTPPATGSINVGFATVSLPLTSNCQYTPPSSLPGYNTTPSINESPIPFGTGCSTNETNLCAIYKTDQVLPGDDYDGELEEGGEGELMIASPDELAKKEVLELLSKGKYNKALDKLNNIGATTKENTDFKAYYEVIINELQKGNTLNNLSKEALEKLRVLATNPTVSGAKARVVLSGLYGEHITKVNSSDDDKRLPINRDRSDNTISKFKVYPNPTSNYINLDYDIKELDLPAKVEIFTGLGALLYSGELTRLKGTLTLLSSSWANGVYLINVKSKNNVLYTQKVVVIHK